MIKRQDGKPVREPLEEMCVAELSYIDLDALTEEEYERFMKCLEEAPLMPTL